MPQPHAWDPERYLTYAGERGRPFVELLTRVDPDRTADPRSVVDLGCGPGNLTGLLAGRWPDARVHGLDSSTEMIARARSGGGPARFEVADLRDWVAAVPAGSVDVLVSNATLQWVPGHLDLLPGLVAAVRPGGWLAFGVPGNFDEPSHRVRRDLAAEPAYADVLADLPEPAAHDAATYLRALAPYGEVDAWETTYLHVLTGPDPVFTWISGTSARPMLEALDAVGGDARAGFEAELKRRLADAYPDGGRGGHDVVMPFRRVFAVLRLESSG